MPPNKIPTPQRLRTQPDGPWVVPLESLRRRDAALAGTKAADLGELAHLGMEVPAGFAVTVPALKAFLASTGLQALVDEARAPQGSHGGQGNPGTQGTHGFQGSLQGLPGSGAAGVQAAAARLSEAILQAQVPAPVAEAIHEAYEALCGAEARPDLRVAVRAAPAASPAGATPGAASGAASAAPAAARLNVRGPDAVVAQVRALWASQALALVQGRPGGVLVQRQVASESAGTVRTVDGDRLAVESAWGLGQPDGATPASDRFLVDKATLAILGSDVVHKGVQVLAADDGVAAHPVDPERADAPSLTPEEVARLAAAALRVEGHFDAPHRLEFAVEWVRSSRRIRIVQATPEARPTLTFPGQPAQDGPAASAQQAAAIPPAGPAAQGRPVTSTKVLAHLGASDDATQLAASADGAVLDGRAVLQAAGSLEPGTAGTGLAEAVAAHVRAAAQAWAPRPVLYRFGSLAAPDQASGAVVDGSATATTAAECAGLRQVRDEGLRNVHVVLQVRTPGDLAAAKRLLDEAGLRRGRDLRVWIHVQGPAPVLAIDRLVAEGIDGALVDLDALAHSLLGPAPAQGHDLHEPALLRALQLVVRACAPAGVATAAAGASLAQPEAAELLVREGIGALAAGPSGVADLRQGVAAAERRLLLDGVRSLRDGRELARFPLPPPPASPDTPMAWWRGT